MSVTPLLPFVRTRAQQIFARFVKFHLSNPHVWRLFERFCNEAWDRGIRRWSARAIIHRVRWEIAIRTSGDGGVKINDHFSPYYGRMYLAKYPRRDGFFERRRRKSADCDAWSIDVATIHDGAPGDERDLLEYLRELAEEGTEDHEADP